MLDDSSVGIRINPSNTGCDPHSHSFGRVHAKLRICIDGIPIFFRNSSKVELVSVNITLVIVGVAITIDSIVEISKVLFVHLVKVERCRLPCTHEIWLVNHLLVNRRAGVVDRLERNEIIIDDLAYSVVCIHEVFAGV